MKLETDIVRPQPDPFVYPVDGGWAMYTTSIEGVQAYSASEPFGPWKYDGIVFRMEGFHEYWAPCMHYEQGSYYLYFSCREIGSEVDRECLWVAKATTPFGPFESPRRLFDCFSIDPHVVRTEKGLYLWYCMDSLTGERVGTRIFVQQLLDPGTPWGEPVEMVKPTLDEEIFQKDRYQKGQHWHTIEGPFWLQVDGWQYVMYSGACYQNDTYHIGYASAKTTEPDLRKVSFAKHTAEGKFAPLMTKNEVEEGVGHHSVIYWQGQYYAVYHARDYEPDACLTVDQRTARICKLRFSDGVITAERMEYSC